MKDYSKHIELAIPDNIRLGEHSDAKLVKSLIATLVVAFEEADDVWMRNRMARVNAAIQAWDKAEFTPHIAKEDEDWNSLKAQIEQNKAESESHKATAENAQIELAKAVGVSDESAQELYDGGLWLIENNIKELHERLRRMEANEANYKGLAGYRAKQAKIKAIQSEIEKEETKLLKHKESGVEGAKSFLEGV